MNLFYCPTINSACVLSEEESQHAIKVLRLQSGQQIAVLDGIGGYYVAEITLAHPKRCEFRILNSTTNSERNSYRLHIAIAPTKNMDRLEWFVEKATEIGIDEITPVFCRFSERKVLKTDRLEKIIISASKQSLNTFFPKLNNPCSFDEFLMRFSAQQKFIAHCYNDERKLLSKSAIPGSECLILIGPEGDFSRDEVEVAIKNGFQPISLGESRLRTETAGIVACSIANFVNQ